MLKINNLSKKFNSKKVLDNISLEVKRGEVAILLGESGVGKSTLLRVLNNLEKPDHGEIYLDDKKIDLKTIARNHIAGMVFQQFNLFDHLTVQNNITLALEKVLRKSKKEAERIAQKLLQEYGLLDQAHKYISQLSGGQKQRIALARALALEPEIICLDEPTSALDPRLTNFIAQNIEDLAQKGYIVLVATHDIALLDKLDCTIYLMKDGKIIEKAPSKEFLRNKDSFPLIYQFVEGNQ